MKKQVEKQDDRHDHNQKEGHDHKDQGKDKGPVSLPVTSPILIPSIGLGLILIIGILLLFRGCEGCGGSSNEDRTEDRTEVLVYELVNVNGKMLQDSIARGFAGYASKKHSDPFIFEITEEVLKNGNLDRDIRFESDYSIVMMLPEKDFSNRWFTVYYCGQGPLVISKPCGPGKAYIYKSKEIITCL